MKTLINLKEKAIRLRKKGFSLIDICDNLKLNKTTVYYWIKDLGIVAYNRRKGESRTKRQKENQKLGTMAMQNKYKIENDIWREKGKNLINEKDFLILCSLYWAEGKKSRNYIRFSNSDVQMIKFFVKNSIKYFNLNPEDFSISLSFYENNSCPTYEEAKNFWTKELNINGCNFWKRTIDKRKLSGRKKGKLKYGICHLYIKKSNHYAQMIYGLLKEYFGCEIKYEVG